MNWLAWRQNRKQFLIAVIFLALFAAVMIPVGLSFWHTYQHTLATCKSTATCDQVNSELFQSSADSMLFHLPLIGILFVPIVLGLFWGVPLLTKEYAEGTNKLVWTQSVSRKKWLTVKLVWVVLGAVITAGAFAALNTWFSKTNNALNLDRFAPAQFDSQGIVPIGYAVFAVALGTALGAWFKRTMAALGVTLFLLLAIVLIIVPNFVRPHLMTPRTKSVWTNQLGPDGGAQSPSGSLVTSSKVINKQGQTLSWANPPKQCIIPQSELPSAPTLPPGHHSVVKAPGGSNGSIIAVNGGPAVGGTCLESAGYHYIVSYQPSYRYWDIQRIETGLYLALSILPIGATYWLVTKRDA